MNIAYGHDKYNEPCPIFASVNFFVDDGLTLIQHAKTKTELNRQDAENAKINAERFKISRIQLNTSPYAVGPHPKSLSLRVYQTTLLRI